MASYDVLIHRMLKMSLNENERNKGRAIITKLIKNEYERNETERIKNLKQNRKQRGDKWKNKRNHGTTQMFAGPHSGTRTEIPYKIKKNAKPKNIQKRTT